MDIHKLLARNVAQFRKERGWSQEELAFESGIHRTYVSGVERGIRNPTITIVEKLAVALGKSPSELFTGWDSPDMTK